MKEPSRTIQQPPPKNKRFNDLTGQVFDRWTVVSYYGIRTQPCGGHKHLFWCRCQCGKEAAVYGDALRSKISRSCGCLTADTLRAMRLEHGLTATHQYQVWQNMCQRIINPNHTFYGNYGGRGLTIDERWLGEGGYSNFYADMGPTPEGCTLERRDNNKGYSKENCYWATRKQQGRNKRNNHLVEFNGEIMCVTAWEEKLGMPEGCLKKRLQRKWTIERAMSQPVAKQPPRRKKIF